MTTLPTSDQTTTDDAASTAVVIGASMAGLATARVLSDHVDRVIVLERDDLPTEPATRRGVPQGRHAHVLLAAGQQVLEGWFPGIVEDLIAEGAVPVGSDEIVWHQAGHHRTGVRSEVSLVSMSRPLLEGVTRRRLLADRPMVELRTGVSVGGLLIEGDRVAGVVADDEELRADLVVDCSGRNTRSFDQLAEAGFPAPEISAVKIEMAYGTRVLRRNDADLAGRVGIIVSDPTASHRIGTIVAVEDDRWIVTVAGFHGDVPPSDPEEFEAFVRSLPSPEIADVLAASEPLSPVLGHRLPTSQRRRVERLRRSPAGFLVLGDAICSFNPVYAQGMTSSAVQAAALERVLDGVEVGSPARARRFYQLAAKVVDVPWKIAAGGDFADPRTTGTKPFATDLTNRYLEKVLLASHTSVEVDKHLLAVQNLLVRPETLFHPRVVLRVLRAARRSPVVTGQAPEQAATATATEQVSAEQAA